MFAHQRAAMQDDSETLDCSLDQMIYDEAAIHSRFAYRRKAEPSNPHEFVQLRRCQAPVKETELT